MSLKFLKNTFFVILCTQENIKRGISLGRPSDLRKKQKFLIAAIGSLFVGLILLAIAFSQISQSASILNTTADLKAASSFSSYGVSANYYLNGNSNGIMKGSLQSSQCCVDFYIFTASSQNNWASNNFTMTNSSNSPVLTVNSSAIDSESGVPASFSFMPDPSATYILVFFNLNRSLWNGSSKVVYQIKSDISIGYSAAPDKFLIYPAVAFLALAVILIFFRTRYSR